MPTNESHQQRYVYSNFVIYANYLGKVTGERIDPAAGCYDLTLHNAQLNDSGWFVCIEDGGLAEVHVRVLDVSGKRLYGRWTSLSRDGRVFRFAPACMPIKAIVVFGLLPVKWKCL
jgi:hypothetical protein